MKRSSSKQPVKKARVSDATRRKNYAILIALLAFISLIFLVTLSRMQGNFEQAETNERVLEEKSRQLLMK